MKTVRFALIALSLSAAAIGSNAAFAADMGGKTRAQVHAELLQAQRDGTLMVNSMTGATYRDLYPSRYPTQPATSGLSQAQVKAELAQARRNGTLIANNMSGATFRDLNPSRYPTQAAMPGKSRDQVQAELAQAQRDGTLIANSQTGATYRDLNPSQYPAMNHANTSVLGMGETPTATRMN